MRKLNSSCNYITTSLRDWRICMEDVKNMLQKLKFLELYLEKLKKELAYLESNDGVKSVKYSSIKYKTNKLQNITETQAIENVKKRKELKDKINTLELDITIIKQAVELLPEEEKQIIIQRYRQEKNIMEIADIHNMSYDTVRNEIKRAIVKISIALRGV